MTPTFPPQTPSETLFALRQTAALTGAAAVSMLAASFFFFCVIRGSLQMKLNVCAVFLLLLCCICLQRVDCSLPNVTPGTPPLQVAVKSNIVTSPKRNGLSRLPGLCRRLKRRRVTIMCNLEKFCWRGRSQKIQSGQVCRCPRGSRQTSKCPDEAAPLDGEGGQKGAILKK
ncbi:uncharacterized protein si:ch211-191i18.4 [Siniperca chuatsi]|uniref:uncharacterized protein si:ch211-191i18.4 n=1 Tax=Siniperca chuatsi TaxID=119488 RepID=UPI001CE05572|nr:uncharacterized protein si:ch211-191i18.4 [Siniperca chuatsi]